MSHRQTRKSAEQPPGPSADFASALVQSAGEAISLIDFDGKILFANCTAAERMGMTADRLVGHNVPQLFPPEVGARHLANIRKTIRSGQGVEYENWTVIGGQKRWYRTSIRPIRDAAGIVASAMVLARDATEQKLSTDALRAANGKLMTAREEERRHLAAELHDSIGQHLVALKLALQSAAPEGQDPLSSELRTALSGVAVHCSDLIREVRGICQGLYPPALESLGLASALRQLAGYCRNGCVKLSVRCSARLACARFEPDLEIALYRIAQEAVNNALRHGQAGRIVVGLGCRRQELWMRVRDDGRGFDVALAGDGGLGLTTMRQRAAAVGGTFEVRSQPGETCVEVRVPRRDRGAPSAGAVED